MRWNGWNEDVKKKMWKNFFLNLPLSDPTTGESDEEVVDEKSITQREKTTKHMLLYFA